jgi:hypothetical protein
MLHAPTFVYWQPGKRLHALSVEALAQVLKAAVTHCQTSATLPPVD